MADLQGRDDTVKLKTGDGISIFNSSAARCPDQVAAASAPACDHLPNGLLNNWSYCGTGRSEPYLFVFLQNKNGRKQPSPVLIFLSIRQPGNVGSRQLLDCTVDSRDAKSADFFFPN